MEEFKYLGSVVDRRGGMMKEVGERITRASRAFGIIKHSILRTSNLPHNTKREPCKKQLTLEYCCMGLRPGRPSGLWRGN